MLALRPHCENCKTPLPPESTEARICSFECTFCRSCVEGVLLNVCPNCGGGFEHRPVRPKEKLQKAPASRDGPYQPVDAKGHAAFAAELSKIPPASR